MTLPESFWGRIVFIIQNYGMSLLQGAGKTLAIAVVGTVLGCIIGFIVGIVQTIPAEKKDNILKRAGNMSQTFAAYFIVSINTGAYMAETVRGGILSIDPGQTEGAKAIGMTHFQTMVNVILPQALRNIMPQIGNNLIINIKDTCVLSVIGTVELFFATKSVAGAYYTFFEANTITMVIYLIMTVTFSKLLRWAETKLDGPQDYNLATSDTLAHTSGMVRYNAKRGASNE